jgi:hypothetical protein
MKNKTMAKEKEQEQELQDAQHPAVEPETPVESPTEEMPTEEPETTDATTAEAATDEGIESPVILKGESLEELNQKLAELKEKYDDHSITVGCVGRGREDGCYYIQCDIL